jgi:murein L,D-transpeptidase YcbB/YkuD
MAKQFYTQAGSKPAWIEGGAPTESARGVIQALQNAATKGLDPEDYDGSRWASRLTALNSKSTDNEVARFDLALTISVMRFVRDLHMGKVNPGLYHKQFELGGNLANFVQRELVSASNVTGALESVEPQIEDYRLTEQALARYLMLPSDSQRELPIPSKPVEPGGSYAALDDLAADLRLLGDLPPDVMVPETYKEPLVGAVKRFQTRHGLTSDGRVGKDTIAELNIPLSRRIQQLQLSLERWRWLPHSFPRPPVIVNIPAFQLRALNQTSQPQLEMKVVVGNAYDHQTPVFAGEMTNIVFRPTWEVPLTIQRKEFVPSLQRNPLYLAQHGFEIVTARGAVVGKGRVNRALLKQLQSGGLHIRQEPGPKNSLGLVKFTFPNTYDVYLHGTPATGLFMKSRRDFSHGCIRVEKPVELAEWVLRGDPAWTEERIRKAMEGGRTQWVKIGQPIPVLIIYATATVEGDQVWFFDDIYGLDDDLQRALAEAYSSRQGESS